MADIEPSHARCILLADDDEIIQHTVKRVAEKRGHRVLRATTGVATLAMAIESLPDIIVLDMGFPDADGRDLLRKLKSDARTEHIPVVVWSGHDSHDSERRISLDLGAEDYVQKSDAELLLRKLERVFLRWDD